MSHEKRELSMRRFFEREGRPSPEPREAGVCPDAETIAAWADDGLAAAERAELEAHVADCARCQMHLATMAAMMPAQSEAPPSAAMTFRSWKWLIPATGAVAAAGLWLMVQAPPAPRSAETPQDVRLQAPEQKSAPVPRREEPPPVSGSAARQAGDARQKQSATSKDLAAAKPEVDQFALERRREAARNAPAAPPPAAEQPAIGALAERITVQTARPADAIDIDSLNVRRLADGRVTWDAGTNPIAAQVTAGVSPAPSVVWLVGKGGLVLLSIDGRSWRRLPFPEPADLVGIEASSEAAATVTTADARTFTTADGGLTWQRK